MRKCSTQWECSTQWGCPQEPLRVQKVRVLKEMRSTSSQSGSPQGRKHAASRGGPGLNKRTAVRGPRCRCSSCPFLFSSLSHSLQSARGRNPWLASFTIPPTPPPPRAASTRLALLRPWRSTLLSLLMGSYCLCGFHHFWKIPEICNP